MFNPEAFPNIEDPYYSESSEYDSEEESESSNYEVNNTNE